jgi:hypothetical protein
MGFARTLGLMRALTRFDVGIIANLAMAVYIGVP